MARGVTAAGAEAVCAPIADGGDGLIDAIAAQRRGEYRSSTVAGPLDERIEAQWFWLPDQKVAIIEMALASGIALLDPDQLQAGAQHSYGTGELIRAALDAGAQEIIVGLGGSACSDAGVGLAMALGWQFFDGEERPLQRGGLALKQVARIDASRVDPRLAQTHLTFLSDVQNPLCGPEGAAMVYAPQKGADASMVDDLHDGHRSIQQLSARYFDCDFAVKPGAGAAGGCGFAGLAFCSAELIPGAESVLRLLNIAEKMAGCQLLLTGEGSLDEQSLFGKAPVVVAQHARQQGLQTVAIAGRLQGDPEAFAAAGIDAAVSLCNGPMPLTQAMANAETLLAEAAEQVVRLWQAGFKTGKLRN